MTNTNSIFSSDDEDFKNNDELELDLNEDGDLVFDDGKNDENLFEDKYSDEDEDSEESDEIVDEEEVEIKDFLSNETVKKEVKNEKESKDFVSLSKSKLMLIKKLLQNAKESNEKVIELLSVFSTEDSDRATISQIGEDLSSRKSSLNEDEDVDGSIIEGVFDGENMIGPDGKQYSIPVNYASKSKLVEGDILKLTILNNGTFIYKQIGPIDRDRIVGVLEKGSNGQFVVSFEGRKWRVLTASVTYFKGSLGDEVIILVPKNADSQWAAVDNVVRSHNY